MNIALIGLNGEIVPHALDLPRTKASNKNVIRKVVADLGIAAKKLTRSLLKQAGYIGIMIGEKLIFGAIRYRRHKTSPGQSYINRSSRLKKYDRSFNRHPELTSALNVARHSFHISNRVAA